MSFSTEPILFLFMSSLFSLNKFVSNLKNSHKLIHLKNWIGNCHNTVYTENDLMFELSTD